MDNDSNKAPFKKSQQEADEAAEIAFLQELCSQHPVSPYRGVAMQMDGSINKGSQEKKEDKANNEKRICNGEIYFIEHVS